MESILSLAITLHIFNRVNQKLILAITLVFMFGTPSSASLKQTIEIEFNKNPVFYCAVIGALVASISISLNTVFSDHPEKKGLVKDIFKIDNYSWQCAAYVVDCTLLILFDAFIFVAGLKMWRLL